MPDTVKYVKKRKSPGKLIFRFFLFLFIVFLTAWSAYTSYNYVMKNQKDNRASADIAISKDKEIFIKIPRGAGTETIANILKENGIIQYPLLFKILSKINGYDGTYHSGFHIVAKGLRYEDLMCILSDKPESIRVTIPEGYTYNQIINLLDSKKLIDTNEFKNIAANNQFDYKFLEGLPSSENRLEGYLFPDTYEFGMETSEEEIINTLLKNFDNKFKDEYYKRADELKMSPYEILILASIIEREAKYPAERPVIAGVFYNRLNSKDKTLNKLQSCATIQYIYMNKFGKVKERITEEDTKLEDPYNTYMHEGLPPGPICNPGEASIKAALYPEKNKFLYFAAKGDGSHAFSETFNQHQAAIRQYGVN